MAMRAGREGLEGGATTIRGIALLDPYFWGKRPVPSETRDPAERRWRDRTWSFVCAGKYGVDDPVINPVAMARDEWRRLGCARVLVTVAGLDMLSARGRAYVAALGASGWGGEAAVRDARRGPRLLSFKARRREGGQGDGGGRGLHQRQPIT